jgi:predicted GH43/DUF377 family glycosyl hydrolase
VWVEELSRFVITCTSYGPAGPAVYLATTRDFSSVDRHGIVVSPEDKNAAILPERVDGKWILFHRPTTGFGITHPGISLSRSSDLASWSPPETVMEPRQGAWWDSLRIGIGPPLLKTEHGWLLIYHGVKETVAGALYRVGAALLDLDEPTRVIGRSSNWILGPREPYERTGDVPNAVFPCGLTHDRASGQLRLYYGAADTSICVATAVLDEPNWCARRCGCPAPAACRSGCRTRPGCRPNRPAGPPNELGVAEDTIVVFAGYNGPEENRNTVSESALAARLLVSVKQVPQPGTHEGGAALGLGETG